MSENPHSPARMRAFDEVNRIVRMIQTGKVMSYGQVGIEARVNARVVGWAMANADEDVPWQRVVGSDGYLRIGKRSPELMALQRSLLTNEGVSFLESGKVDMALHNCEPFDPL